MEYFLNLLYKTQICTLNEINFKIILEESYRNKEYYNTDMSKYLLKLNFNISDNDFENINISDLKKKWEINYSNQWHQPSSNVLKTLIKKNNNNSTRNGNITQ
ncbi:hypothetical protein H8356DRAFT_1342652 [Neocallimastix lanati (nom. inval.)]|nr:hypothetical protein H8356DRAFT_1342652 [Neocallimastix sp. JGI-2020a]